jgi:hypothetical protein
VITEANYLNGREKNAPLTPIMVANMKTLLSRVNKLAAAWGKPLVVTSGYRPAAANAAANGKPGSAHLSCSAVDVADPTKELAKWTLANLPLLEELGLYIEDPAYTVSWVHYTIRAPKSGKRVFKP